MENSKYLSNPTKKLFKTHPNLKNKIRKEELCKERGEFMKKLQSIDKELDSIIKSFPTKTE